MFGDGLIVAVAGVVIGSLAGAALARGLGSLQHGVTPGDPASWLMVLAIVWLTTVLASWRPAHTAARMDPLVMLRAE